MHTDPLLTTTDWPHLIHAYGWATDTSRHLRALLSENADKRNTAINHLNSALNAPRPARFTTKPPPAPTSAPNS